MINRLLTFATLCILAITSVQAQTKIYKPAIGDFSEITISDNINVRYKHSQDSAGTARFISNPEIAHAVTFTNNKGKLKIEVISDKPITEPIPEVIVYSSGLNKATNYGDSTLTIETLLPCEKISFKIVGNGTIRATGIETQNVSAAVEAGSGHIYLNGKTKDVTYTLAGTGAIEGGDLKATNVKTKMVGTGSIDCSASETLNVYGLGSGTVYYAGNPKLKKRNLGVKIVQMSGAE